MRNALIFSIFTILLISCQKIPTFPLDSKGAYKIVEPELNSALVIYQSKGLVPANTEFTTFAGPVFSPDKPTWMIGAMMNYLVNSGGALYFFVDPDTGDYTKCKADSPLPYPADKNLYIECECVRSDKYHMPSGLEDEVTMSSTYTKSAEIPSDEDYRNWGILISGGGSPSQNYSRFWSACRDMYNMLHLNYCYPKSQLFVIMSDGTDSGPDMNIGNETYISSPLNFDCDLQNEVQYAATKSNISTVFNFLRDNVSAGDQVFIYICDHGGLYNGNAYICLWNGETMYPSELAAELDKLPSTVTVNILLGQCNSGGFIDELEGNGRSVVSTCSSSESSWADYFGDVDYNIFEYYWIRAMQKLAGNSNDEAVSFSEAFTIASNSTYALRNDQHPQYSAPSTLWNGAGLCGQIFVPILTGAENIRYNQPYDYVLSNYPSEGYSITWQLPSWLNVTFSEINHKKISSLTNEPVSDMGIIRVTIEKGITKYQRSISIYAWKSGLFISNTLIDGWADTYTFTSAVSGFSSYLWSSSNPDWEALYQGRSYVDFDRGSSSSQNAEYVEVSMKNYFGEDVTIRKYLSQE